MATRQNLRYFLHARVFIAYMLFPFLRVLAASVPMAAAISMLLEPNNDLPKTFLNHLAGFEDNDSVRDTPIPYFIKGLLIFSSILTMVASVVNFFQGLHLIRDDTINDHWSQTLEDYMDGFMFAACGNLALNVTLIVCFGNQRLPHPVFLGVVVLLTIVTEVIATCFSHSLADSVDFVYYEVQVVDQFEVDENIEDAAEDLQNNEYNYMAGAYDPPPVIPITSK